MIKETCETSIPSLATETDQTPPYGPVCRSFRALKTWQADQYRMAVDENKWYMSERLGRNVEWDEAEDDFLHNGYYGCAPKWRKEFCSYKCTHSEACKLGRHFCQGT